MTDMQRMDPSITLGYELQIYSKLGKWNSTSVLDLKCLFLHLTGISLVDAPCQATSSILGRAPSQLNSQFVILCLSS